MFKVKEKDVFISDIKVYYSCISGYRVKGICRSYVDTTVSLFDVPFCKLHVFALPCDGAILKRFGFVTKVFVSPDTFLRLKFERRK